MNLISGYIGILFLVALVTTLVLGSIKLTSNKLGYRAYSYFLTEITALLFLISILFAYQHSTQGLIFGIALILVDLYFLRRTVNSLRRRGREDKVRKGLMDFFDGLNKEGLVPYSVDRPPILKAEMAGFERNKKIFRFIIMPMAFLLPVILYAAGTQLDYLIGYGIFILLPFLIVIGLHFDTSKMYAKENREIIKGVIINKHLEEEDTSPVAGTATSQGHFNISGRRILKVGSDYDRFTLGDIVEITLWGSGNPRYNRITSIKKTGQLLPGVG